MNAIVKRTRQGHPYEFACVAGLPIIDGDQEYARWIIDETSN